MWYPVGSLFYDQFGWTIISHGFISYLGTICRQKITMWNILFYHPLDVVIWYRDTINNAYRRHLWRRDVIDEYQNLKMCEKAIFHNKKQAFMNRRTFTLAIHHSWDTCILHIWKSHFIRTIMTCKHVSLFIENVSRLLLAFLTFIIRCHWQ